MKTQEINQITGNISTDDRGSLKFINDFNFDGIKRFYQVQNHCKNFIRAWHGHIKEAKLDKEDDIKIINNKTYYNNIYNF